MVISSATTQSAHVVRFDAPAPDWTAATPIGNGIRAALCEGRRGGERLWLNDTTAWSGRADDDPLREVSARGAEALGAVRGALEDGDLDAAEAAARRMQIPWAQAFVPVGWIDVDVVGAPPSTDNDEADGYERVLDLTTAVATHRYRLATDAVGTGPGPAGATAGDEIVHDSWADRVTGAVVHRVRSDAPVRLRVRQDSLLPLRESILSRPSGTVAVRDLPVDVAPGHARTPTPVRFEPSTGRTATVTVVVSTYDHRDGDDIVTSPATDHLIQIGTTTAPLPPGVHAPPVAVDARASADELRRAHSGIHREQYLRCTVELGAPDDVAAISTAERVRRAAERPDPGLSALLFHFGRYLLISSSQPGGLPLTLQGLWNIELPGPWSSAYTTNINLQMAYWAAECTALPECHLPLLEFVRRTAATTGQRVARELYDADGWVMHHNSDAWGAAAPVGGGDGDPAWSTWPMGGIWLALHAWDHFAFGGDREQLRASWPALWGAARFALSWICGDDDTAWTSPSTSPENTFLDASDNRRALSRSTTMDVALLRELARVCALAAAELGVVDDEVDALLSRTAALPDPWVTAEGAVAEWAEDVTEAEPLHRHLSHLVGLYPFAQITPHQTPDLAAAAARSIRLRGPESTGWALAWRIALWARLRDGARVQEQIALAQRPAAAGEHRGGLYPNLFSAHPPFQIDGNLGLVAGVAEALVQSHEGVIDLLPALPPEWVDGAAHGLRVRGGATVDLAWTGGVLASASLLSPHATTVEVRMPGRPVVSVRLTPGDPVHLRIQESP